MRSVHPFPARMASDIALEQLRSLPAHSVVLDPMMGSGTVVSNALSFGHRAIGCDVDPLAVLMSQVRATAVSPENVQSSLLKITARASHIRDLRLPWIDDDQETRLFVDYWFAVPQQESLRRLAKSIQSFQDDLPSSHLNIARICLSRIIVTKDSGASLARDVSHSRPHRVKKVNDFDVFASYRSSLKRLLLAVEKNSPQASFDLRTSDARDLRWIRDDTVDAIITSPPYLNAIDYMRGHRLALVWLGYNLKTLRNIRASSTGAERGFPAQRLCADEQEVYSAFGQISDLTPRQKKLVARYAVDLLSTVKEASRVLKPQSLAIYVIGDSCVRNTYVCNSDALVKASSICGLTLVQRSERLIPASSRYLPTTDDIASALSKRMRREVVLHFRKNAA